VKLDHKDDSSEDEENHGMSCHPISITKENVQRTPQKYSALVKKLCMAAKDSFVFKTVDNVYVSPGFICGVPVEPILMVNSRNHQYWDDKWDTTEDLIAKDKTGLNKNETKLKAAEERLQKLRDKLQNRYLDLPRKEHKDLGV
jgi:hypothetical protein